MSRIPLKIQGVTDITATNTASLLIITDMEEQRQLSVVCNEIMRHEFGIRRGKYTGNKINREQTEEMLKVALPETISAIIKYMTDLQLAVVIVSVYDGQYRAVIEDVNTGTAFPIRISDGALLCYADTHIPLYIEASLWERQSVPYLGQEARGIAMPLNTLSIEMLEQALKKSIEEEKYELAKQLKDEIDRRESVPPSDIV